METQAKKWWRSKTVWFNIAGILIAIGTELPAILPYLDPAIATSVQGYLILGMTIGNIILRSMTQHKITR